MQSQLTPPSGLGAGFSMPSFNFGAQISNMWKTVGPVVLGAVTGFATAGPVGMVAGAYGANAARAAQEAGGTLADKERAAIAFRDQAAWEEAQRLKAERKTATPVLSAIQQVPVEVWVGAGLLVAVLLFTRKRK